MERSLTIMPIGVFLPAGSVSALAYSPSEICSSGFNKMQVHQASGLFGFTGLQITILYTNSQQNLSPDKSIYFNKSSLSIS